jgi:Tol biopolymer transport system component
MRARDATHGRMEGKLMPDFDTRTPREPDEPNGLRSRSLTDRVRNSLIANRLRTLLIGGGILLFAMVAVSVLAVSYYGSVSRSPSPSVEAKEPDRAAPTQRCEGIHPDAIRNDRIAFDLAGEAAPVVEDPEGMGIADQDIWTVNPDGSDPVNLTANPSEWDETPAWSPDGERIAFVNTDPVADQPNLAGRIYFMDHDGCDGIEISPPGGESVVAPSWSPDGQRIAFWSTSDSDIFLANADGSGTPKQLSIPGFSGSVARPEWSPDGGRIAFQGAGEDTWADIYVMNVSAEGDTSGLRRLTDFRYMDEDPAWSPDGTEIAFTSNRAIRGETPYGDKVRQSEIYKIDVASLRVTRLTHSTLQDTDPTWSPDGTHIAYVKQKLVRGTHSSIYRMDSDGSNSAPVFEEEEQYAFHPDWAP